MPKLHFSIGPVQGFVGQSRRTRDLWASSFLLSYLAGHSILAIDREYDAHAVLPQTDSNRLYQWLDGNRPGEPPKHGSIPNRFVLDCEAPREAAKAAEQALKDAWQEVADAVWKAFVADVADRGFNTRAIWERQVENFWEVYWVVGEDPGTLDIRKNWRDMAGTVEPGDKCTMMHRWQEISGYVRSKKRQKQDSFWKAFRNQSGIGTLDLGEDERLSAVALIKRLYPRLTGSGDGDLIGWRVEASNWPSTAYMAAAPWLAHAVQAAPDQAVDYAEQVLRAARGARGEWNTDLKSLSGSAAHGALEDFLSLDGNFYFPEAIENDRATPLDTAEDPQSARTEIAESISGPDGLYKQCDATPSRFYALLMMDGDSMGALLREADELSCTGDVSKALGDFTDEVEGIVQKHDGITVYAGGDDVLALMTLPDALPCAAKLRQAYLDAFAEVRADYELSHATTISAGLVYAHYKTPLSEVIGEAHYLLDDIAKAQTGRASLAVSALKSGGRQYQWTMPWVDVLRTSADFDGPTILDELIRRYQAGQFSSSYIYRLRDLFMLWSEDEYWSPGEYVEVGDLAPAALLLAEYADEAVDSDEVDETIVEEAIDQLLEASWRVRRRYLEDEERFEIERPRDAVGFDAPLLMRFLSQQLIGTSSDDSNAATEIQ